MILVVDKFGVDLIKITNWPHFSAYPVC